MYKGAERRIAFSLTADRTAMSGRLFEPCARAVSGQKATPPRSVMKLRRCMCPRKITVRAMAEAYQSYRRAASRKWHTTLTSDVRFGS